MKEEGDRGVVTFDSKNFVTFVLKNSLAKKVILEMRK